MTVRLNTLGRLQVFRGPEELKSYAVRGTRCALLLYIALERDTTRDAAMGLVWPESSPEKARHSLSQTLYELRKDLGEDWIESAGEVLRASDLESDAERFVQAVEAERYEEALDLYHGAFLEGTYLVDSGDFQRWVERQRSAIDRMRRNAQRAELERRLGLRDLEGALAVTYSWVECDPLDDEAQHALVKLLADAGRRSEALSQFDEFERMLRRELEVSPLEETCRLIEQIRAGNEEVLGAGRPGPGPEVGGSSVSIPEGAHGTEAETVKSDRGVRGLLEATLAGEFDVVRKIGEGLMAEIFLAREVSLRRLVAIKVLRPEHAETETARRRFIREAQAAARVSDPNVAAVFRTGFLQDDLPYLVMEWIKGTSLADWLASGTQLGEDGIRRVVLGIAKGLAGAHAKRIVHRDVRPDNVLVEEDTGRVALTDFGIAATLATGAETPERLTETGELLSHPRYAAPEQFAGHGVTERADIYSLGVIAFEMLTGEHPFGEMSAAEMAAAKLHDEPRGVLAVREGVDPGLAAVVDRCLARSAERRPRAVEVVAELGGVAARGAVTGPEHTQPKSGSLLSELRARRIPVAVGGFFLLSWGLLFWGNALVEAGAAGPAVYPLLLVFLASGFHAVLIRTWFHGKPGEHPTSAMELWMLGAVVWVWAVVSLLVVMV